MDWRARSARLRVGGAEAGGGLCATPEGGRGNWSVVMAGDGGSTGDCDPDIRLRLSSLDLKAIERRVLSARVGRRLSGRAGFLNSAMSISGFCFGGSRLTGDADCAGSAKFKALSTVDVPSKSLLWCTSRRPKPANAPSRLATDSSVSSLGDGKAGVPLRDSLPRPAFI